MSKNLFHYSFLLFITLFIGCRPYRNSTEYVVRTQLVKHTPNETSAYNYRVLLKKWSRPQQSYLEVGHHAFNDQATVLLTSDDFENYNRYNILAGIYRQHVPKKEGSIRYTSLDSLTCAKFLAFQKELAASNFALIQDQFKGEFYNFDYAFSEDTFIHLHFFRSAPMGTRPGKINVSKRANLWVKGRKHPIDLSKFNEAITRLDSFSSRVKAKPTKVNIGFPAGRK